ncbi:MAG: HAD family hydrolase [Candidatus Omnitrophica bacterium]|nr:HAD family hydrolase [Candidatus Omnitrophota bacterium]MDD5574595.1 HAD family hydrolase [Candidatus Omnitrophota bacterium]
MVHPQIYIFDLDGTLVDAYPAIVRSFNGCMSAFGYPVQKEGRIRSAVGWGDRNLLKPFVPPGRLAKVLACYRQRHARDLKGGVSWMPHARGLLGELKRKGAKLAVASNRPTRFTRIIIGCLGAERLFDRVLCADRLRFGKPHPLILREILKGFGAAPKDAVYIGDMAIDVQTGRRAGVTTAAIATGSSTLKELKREKPDYLFSDLGQFKKGFCLKP